MKTFTAGKRLLLSVVLALALVGSAQARGSGIQVTPDGHHVILQKDVGPEHWSINYNLDDSTITGNVSSDASCTSDVGIVPCPPVFLWCNRVNETSTDIVFSCASGFSLPNDPWVPLPGEVPIPKSFLGLVAAVGPGGNNDCDLTLLTNGSSSATATSVWNCVDAIDPTYQFAVYADSTGSSTSGGGGSFSFVQTGCHSGVVTGTSGAGAGEQALVSNIHGSRATGSLSFHEQTPVSDFDVTCSLVNF